MKRGKSSDFIFDKRHAQVIVECLAGYATGKVNKRSQRLGLKASNNGTSSEQYTLRPYWFNDDFVKGKFFSLGSGGCVAAASTFVEV